MDESIDCRDCLRAYRKDGVKIYERRAVRYLTSHVLRCAASSARTEEPAVAMRARGRPCGPAGRLFKRRQRRIAA